MRPAEIRTLFEYHYWASELVWDCIMQISDDQFAQELHYSTGSIRGLMLHTLSATRRWIDRIEKLPATPHPNPADFPTRQAVKAAWDEARTATLAYLGSLTEEKLDRPVHWELPNRNLTADHPLWQLLLHAFNHTTDHRSQVLALLNQHFHIETPEQDLLFYLLEQTSEVFKTSEVLH